MLITSIEWFGSVIKLLKGGDQELTTQTESDAQRRQRICILIDDYLPSSTRVGAKMMHELAKEFKSRGLDVTVIAPDSTTDRLKEFTLDGVAVRLFPALKTKNMPSWRRAIGELSLPIMAFIHNWHWVQRSPHDLVVYYSPCIFWGHLVAWLKARWNCQAFLVLRDLFPQWAIDNGLLKENSIVTSVFRWFERKSYKEANVIGIQSDINLAKFKAANPEYQSILLNNWAELRPYQGISSSFRLENALGEKVVFFYGGAITVQQDIPNLLRLAQSLKGEPAAHFVIMGDGYEVGNVMQIVKENGLDNVSVLPSVDQETFRSVLAEVDVGLFSLSKSHTTHNFPGKVLGYLVEGLPVLGSVNHGNDLESIINGSGSGFVFENGQDVLLKESAIQLLASSELRAQCGVSARKLLEEVFSTRVAADSILGAVNQPRGGK